MTLNGMRFTMSRRCRVLRHRGRTRWPVWPCVCTAALWFVAAGAAESAPKGTLSGKVLDANGRPVGQARVWTQTVDAKTSSLKLLAEARTNADGRFRLGPI